MKCTKCGSEIPETSRFCNNCGSAVKDETAPVREKKGISPGVWILLATAVAIAGFLIFKGLNKTDEIVIQAPVTSYELKIGENVRIDASYTSSLNKTYQPEWISGDENIVTVTDGTISGVAQGSTTVTYRVTDEVSAQFTVKVDRNTRTVYIKTREITYNFDGSVDYVSDYTYNMENGCLLQQKNTFSDVGEVITIEYTYDDNWNLIRETNTSNMSDEKMTTRYEYDDDGRLKAVIAEDEIWGDSGTRYFYDEKDRIIREEYYNEGGSLENYVTYEYDADDNPVREQLWLADGTKSFRYENTYENGLLVKSVGYDESGKMSGYAEYKYDENGNLISESYYDDEQLIWYDQRDYQAIEILLSE